jgi:hypothetical protein
MDEKATKNAVVNALLQHKELGLNIFPSVGFLLLKIAIRNRRLTTTERAATYLYQFVSLF